MIKSLLYIVLLLVSALALPSREMKIVGIDPSRYPSVTAKLFIYDSLGLEFNIGTNLISVMENGSEASIAGLKKSESPTRPANVLLAIDLAGKGLHLNYNLNISKQLALSIVRNIYLAGGRAALLSYDKIPYLNADFSNTTGPLLACIKELTGSPGSDLGRAFNYYPTGIFETFDGFDGSKSLIIIGDTPLPDSMDVISARCLAMGIRVVFISIFSDPAPEIKELCASTGGIWMVYGTGPIANSAALATASAAGYSPAELAWETVSACGTSRKVDITLYTDETKTVKETKATVYYTMENHLVSSIEVAPEELNLYLPGLGGYSEDSITITASSDIIIDDASFTSPEFKIICGSVPLNGLPLEAGKKHVFCVRSQTVDSLRHFAMLDIWSGGCVVARVPVISGYPNRTKEKSLSITAPGCGAMVYSGDTCTITWDGTISSEPVSVEYSTDMGNNWQGVARFINGSKYVWTVPTLNVDSLDFRVSQIWPPGLSDTIFLQCRSKVLSAFFNKYGDKVALAMADSSVEVRNSYTGSLIYQYKPSSGPVSFARFDPIDDNIVFNSGPLIITYNMKTKTVRTSDALASEPVLSFDINPLGNRLLAAYPDGIIRSLQLPGLAPAESINTGQGKLFSVRYGPDGRYFASCGTAGNIKVWHSSSNSQVYELSAGSSVCMYASFSQTMDKIAAASWYGKTFVWNLQPGKSFYNLADTAYTVTHMKDTSGVIALNYTEFTYDSTGREVLITAGLDRAALWDASNGKNLGKSIYHRNNVSTATANIDGSRVVTASWDSTAVIINLFRKVVQSDIGGCRIALGRADIARYEIDFGETAAGHIKDTMIINGIEKISGYNFPIEVLGITGANPESFRLISPNINSLVMQEGSLPLYIRFRPEAPGISEALLNIKIPGKETGIKLVGSSYAPAISLKSNTIDFSNVDLGDFSDTTIKGYLTNNTDSNINFKFIKVKDDFHLAGGSSIDLEPYGTYDLYSRFMSIKPGRHSSVIEMNFASRPYRDLIQLYAKSVAPVIDTIEIGLPNIEEASGKEIILPIKVKKLSDNGAFARSGGIGFILAFNGTILEPKDKSNIIYSGGICRQRIEIPYFESDSIDYPLEFITALGNDSLTRLEAINPKPNGVSKVFIKMNEGSFKISDVCRDGGIRLFRDSGQPMQLSSSPNPFSDFSNIEFNLIENTYCRLYITDILGYKVKMLAEGFYLPGRYFVSYKPDSLESGIYYFILETQAYKLTKSFVYIKN